MIVITRIDERLVHGQIGASWAIVYNIDRVVVVDDEAANSEIERITFELAIALPRRLSLLKMDDAVKFLNEKTNERLLIVTKSPHAVLNLIRNGVDIKSVNVGGMYFLPGRKRITRAVYLNDDDKSVFLELKKAGIEAEIRCAPHDRSIDLYRSI